MPPNDDLAEGGMLMPLSMGSACSDPNLLEPEWRGDKRLSRSEVSELIRSRSCEDPVSRLKRSSRTNRESSFKTS